MSTESLKYLSVDQSLADTAHFITEFKRTHPRYANSSVVVIGGSYSATMATWFRQKYPHLVVGAWASSAPLLAQVDFKEYKEVVAQSIELIGGKTCLDAVAKGFALAEELVTKNQTDELKKVFNLCDDFDGSDKWNIWNLFSEISDIFAGVVQGHRYDKIRHGTMAMTSLDFDFFLFFKVRDELKVHVLRCKISQPQMIHKKHATHWMPSACLFRKISNGIRTPSAHV